MGVISDAWEKDPDLEKRDPNDLNDHLHISFEETIGEPDHTHSIDCVWKYSYKCYNLWKTLCYIIITCFCGIPIAICWGCYFACVAFQHIWEITPSLRAFEIMMHVQKKYLTIICDAVVAPCFDAMGNIFNAFKK